jgi:hypothetical protein
MRKLLLATVAALGASMGAAAVADAQTASPEPGTVTVRLNGRFRFYAGIVSDRNANNNASGSSAAEPNPTGGVNAQGQGALPGTNKQSNYMFGDYARLYPGFDGVAANGLKYGASLEIRQDNASGAGNGAYGSASQQDARRGTLYFRREWGYIGTDQLGTIRLGSTDQPSSLYITGTFENFNDGGFDGDVGALASQNTVTPFPFSDGAGSYYTTTKAIYLSPQLYGFDFGVSFEPNTGNVNALDSCGTGSPFGANFVNAAGAFTAANGASSQGVSGPGCDRLSSSPFNSESARRKNTVDALLRYRGTFGAFGVAATGAFIGGSHVLDNSGRPFNNNGAAGAIRPNYDGMSVGDFGIAVTYGGLSVGGHYSYGRFNETMGTLVPKGLQNTEAAIAGVSYTVGPLIVGAQYLNIKAPGDVGNAYFGRNRYEWGIAGGATYSLAPGLALFASYLYSDRKQSGYNFITGQGVTAGNPGGNPYSNKVSSQVFAVGTGFSW